VLKQRVITASVLVPLVFWLVFWGSHSVFAIAVGIFLAIGGWEWARLSGIRSEVGRVGYAALTSGLCYWLYVTVLQPDVLPWLYLLGMGTVVLLWLFNISQIFLFDGQQMPAGKIHIGSVLIGCVVLPGTWSSLLHLHQMSPNILFLCLLLIWVADTGAYFSGRRWGRRKLAPRVSPGKSWEGVWGGLVAVFGVALFASFWMFGPFAERLIFVCLAMIGVIFSVFGDLYESLLKRRFGLKDSSHILPGHGGILDRADSLTAAMPVFSVGLVLIEQCL